MTRRNGGNDELFRALYDKYYWRIVAFYVRVFRVSQEDAEDLAQDAFLRFLRAMDEYRGDAEWAFLEKIARHVAYNRIRSQNTVKRAGRLVAIDDPSIKNEPAAPHEPDFAERDEEERRHKLLHAAIATLPPGQQQVIRLQLSGLTYDQMAATLRITLDAVRSRRRDALRQLKQLLGDEPNAVALLEIDPEDKQ